MAYYAITSEPNAEGYLNIIVNKTKRNYIRTSGNISADAVDSLHRFMIQYGVWHSDDEVFKSYKLESDRINPQIYHDITFILRFYDCAYRSYIFKEQRKKQAERKIKPRTTVSTPDHFAPEQTTPLMPPPRTTNTIYQSMTNPNIRHQIDQHMTVEECIQELDNAISSTPDIERSPLKELEDYLVERISERMSHSQSSSRNHSLNPFEEKIESEEEEEPVPVPIKNVKRVKPIESSDEELSESPIKVRKSKKFEIAEESSVEDTLSESPVKTKRTTRKAPPKKVPARKPAARKNNK